jgi:serine protease Do
MTTRNLWVGGGAALIGLTLIVLPGRSAAQQQQQQQDPVEEKVLRLERQVEALQKQIVAEQQRMASEEGRLALQRARAMQEAALGLRAQEPTPRVALAPGISSDDNMTMVIAGDDNSWLGVESQEVNGDKAKELKLPAERGVLLDRIVPDSPAAKAGLKENDVITEINGQRVEGETQFRRMIHEIPAGRSAQFTVWRDGHAQTINVTLGKSEDQPNAWIGAAPRAFSFELPKVEIPDMQIMPDSDWNYGVVLGARPRLGIDAEDLSGQFGSYFGAPDGEGVLVREVNSGSPAEKAGMKSGDVITSVDGDRVRSLGDLREKLAEKHEAKTVKLGILRNKSQLSVTVELPEPQTKGLHRLSHSTNI